jgi:RNA methyltransferase, TrmH family
MRERFADTSGGGLGAQGVENGSSSGSISGRAPRVVLFGNEARGLPQEVLDAVDRIVSIPLYGHAESLNLATSAAVMLFSIEMARRVDR